MANLPQLGPGPCVLAIDVGGTLIKRAWVDASGCVHELEPVPTPRTGKADDIVRIVVATRDEMAGAGGSAATPVPTAASVVLPGIVDADRGHVSFTANLGYRDVPLREMLTAALNLPVYVGHDVAAAGYAEQSLGAAAGCSDVAVITIGTGIAAALFIDGRPLIAGGYAGEICHLRVETDPLAPLCVCGQRGCLEAIASSASIARLYGEATGAQVNGSREVFAAAVAGDADAKQVIDRAILALADASYTLAATLGVSRIVIAGGLARAGEAVLDPLRQALKQRLTYQREPEIVAARLGARAGLIGSALRARELAAT